ncbi:patched domain-containing protein 3-like [Mizuhopecten yessoensis]|uniref:Patched domain-containing protein 3 n=1 Tax=Mizuhopecten yessoensis TaxID=6573 RepID=A0A210QRN2_MIZYE|nr:patched domain-containing protein 3-like [Mizuhopecten yessoensis]XP_021351723.1 patched domain-containing protein 3-like [Mizuhopecten yessoensis]XP_021351724.1 patched domain-containing protein 3-like [Mizuhopecten yessoensis]OWF51348.1 Patched domain-containing protein 3 [Mizuhopecten yessoensis]
MKFTRFYKRWEEKLGTPFEKYGAMVSRYPWHILIACVTINCLLGLGLFRIESETDTETLYTPQNSQSKADRAVVRSIFTDDKSGSNFYSKSTTEQNMYADIIIKPKDGSNVLTTTYVDETERIYNYINTMVNVTIDGTTLSLADVCALRSGSCVVDGDFVFSTAFRTAMASNTISYPLFNFEYLSGAFGDAQSSGGYLTSAKMVRLIFYLRQDTSTASSRSTDWEKKYIEMLETVSSSLVDIAYSTSTSLDDELAKNVNGDILYFAVTMAMMLSYAGFATSGGDCVSDRQNLGRAGVVATGIAILGGFGLVSAVGVKFVSIVGTLPFLIIGIGLDDMFILMSCLADCPVKGTIEEKLKETMRTGGVAITITSITDFLAFAIGASASFISVRNFCLYAGVAVLFCYINQLTFFLPCMAINERRMARHYHCGTCRPIETREELRAKGKPGCHVFCCGGQVPRKRNDNESPLEKYPKLFFQNIVQSLPGKITIAVLFVAYLAATVYGITNFKRGLLLSNLVNEDSYFYTYSKLTEGHFTSEITIGFTVTSTQTYSDATIQSRISDLLSNARADADINPSVTFDWLTDYKSSGYYSAVSETSFIAGLKTFLTTRPDHANDVVINSAETNIVGARFFVLTNDLPDSEERGNIMLQMREVADNSPLPVVCFSWPFIYFDEYASVFSITFTTVGVAIAAMFVVTLLFMPHPLLVVCVTGTMVMICAGMFGFMHFWDLTLSSITMIDIVLSIGFSVDFSAHICHAYITVDGATRKERVHRALDRAGGPIINAAISSIMGIVVLAFSSSYIFKSFFKLMFLVMVFGLAHSLLLLPLIFSLVGPVTEVTVTPKPSVTDVNVSTISVPSDQQTNDDINKPDKTELDNGEGVYNEIIPQKSELDNWEDIFMTIPNGSTPNVTISTNL